MTDRVSLNYIKNAMTISHLLTQIMAEDKNKQALYAKIQSDKKQIKSLNLRIESLGQTAASQQNKIVEIDKLIEQVNTLENEKKLLQQQLNRLKEIDLTPNNIIGNTVPSE
jgi:TolA-binding protein